MFNPTDIATRIADRGREWAQMQSQANLLEEQGKSLLALITKELIAAGDSATQAHSTARADPRWEVHINGLVVAQEKAIIAKTRYEAAKEYSQNMRTEQATRRAEMQLT